ncbi:kinetochore Sim4 complex subunit Fta2, partial [Diaporthe sp. PMI_573]
YTDPFCAECRAYGRIQEASETLGFNSQLAVKCHGYMYLGDEDKNRLEYMGLDLGTAVLDDQLRQALDGGGRVRAIVKDLAPARPPITSSNVQAARQEVMKLHELKIYVREISVGKFCDGKLVSLSYSWTEPHTILDALGADEAEEESAGDLVMFDEMIE